MIPPGPPQGGSRRKRTDSTGSNCSIHSQSGDWDIEERERRHRARDQKSSSQLQHERQHVGWKVSNSEQVRQLTLRFKRNVVATSYQRVTIFYQRVTTYY